MKGKNKTPHIWRCDWIVFFDETAAVSQGMQARELNKRGQGLTKVLLINDLFFFRMRITYDFRAVFSFHVSNLLDLRFSGILFYCLLSAAKEMFWSC